MVNVIDSQRSVPYFVEARDQLGQRRFAATGEPDKCHFSTRKNMQIYPFQNRPIRRVAEGDVLKADIPSQLLWSMVGGGILQHFRSLIQHFLYTLSARSCTTPQVCQFRDITHGLV